MNTLLIDSFLESADTGSFTKAADNLYTSQQSISRNVALMETELGVQLFNRARDGLTLTDAGRYYLAAFRSMHHVGELAKEELRRVKERREREVLIGCSPIVNPYGVLMDAIIDFRAKHSGIRISLRICSSEELLEKLEKRTLDIALFSGSSIPTSFSIETVSICREDIRLYGPTIFFSEEGCARRNDAVIGLVSQWNNSAAEETVRLRQILAQTDLAQSRVRMLPNISSLILAMQRDSLLAIADARFGYLDEIEGLSSEKLDIQSNLLACLPAGTQNYSARALVEHLRETASCLP